MANIDPVGIDLVTGQYKRTVAADTLRPDTGTLNISGGVDSTVLSGDLNLLTNLVTGDGGESGSISLTTGAATLGTTIGSVTGDLAISTGNVNTGTNNDQGDSTGSITIQTGTTGAGNGTAGSISIVAGGTVEDSSSAGDITITAGTAGGISTGGDLSLSAGGGYTAGNMSLTTQTPGPGGGGQLSVSSGTNITMSAADDIIANSTNLLYTMQESVTVICGDSGTNGFALIESKGGGGEIRLRRNPGTPTTEAWLDDNGFHVTGGPIIGDQLGDGTGPVAVSTQSGSVGGDGTRLYITPNLGIILEIGNTIKMNPDGTNNFIYGDDGQTASDDGEPLTLRGGHGHTTSNGAPLRLNGGDGGVTSGDGGNVELHGGTVVSGTAGTVCVGTITGDLIRFYGTATGTAQQTVTGSRGGNAALADLLTKLATLGIVVDGTSA